MLKTVKIEIFDDAQTPVTCARYVGDPKRSCPQLLQTRWGTEFQCRLFTGAFGESSDFLQIVDGFITPTKECLEQRSKGEA